MTGVAVEVARSEGGVPGGDRTEKKGLKGRGRCSGAAPVRAIRRVSLCMLPQQLLLRPGTGWPRAWGPCSSSQPHVSINPCQSRRGNIQNKPTSHCFSLEETKLPLLQVNRPRRAWSCSSLLRSSSMECDGFTGWVEKSRVMPVLSWDTANVCTSSTEGL